MNLREPDDALPVESRLDALLIAGHDRTRATELLIEETVAGALDARTAVLVEGVSDQIVLEILAIRSGRHLLDEGVAIVPMGGVTNIRRFLAQFGTQGQGARMAGLYDLAEEEHIRRGLEQAGLGRDLDRAGLEALGFFVCEADLEDELIRSLGTGRVEQIIEAEGKLSSLRTMQNEPFHRGRPYEQQLHRFIGSHRYRYARLLAEALDLSRIPRPLERLLDHL